jgi:tetratricopeptide (TPR) repeat protein
MSKKNLLSGRDKELHQIAEQYEAAKAENKAIYLDADDFADLADWYAVRRKYDIATEVAEYGLTLHPDSTALLVEQAYLCLDTQKKEKAKEIAKCISEESSEVKVLKASLLMGEGKIEEADAMLESIEDKEELANIVDVSYMYIDMGLPGNALPWLTRGLEKYAEEEAFLAVTGDCYYAQGLLEKATFFFNKLIDKNPYSASYWFGLARCHFDLQMFDKAIEECDYAIVADDEFADAYIMKGHAFYQLGNEESALESYKMAEKLGVVSRNFINTFIGLSLVSKGKWAEGYSYLEKAISEEGDEEDELTLPALYANAALCLHKLGKKRKAHQYCKKAHELAPEDIDAYLVEGRIYIEEGDFEKGIKQWGLALRYAPYADTWHEIGELSMEMGEMSYAKLAFERVKEMEPDFEGINEKLASLYMILKDKDNFMKYNQLCENPFNLDELEKIQQLLENDNQQDLAQVMKSIFDALK